MPEPERGSDHAARIASLCAFEASISRNVEAGLAELGALDEPLRVYAALQLLVQNDRFRDAADLAGSHQPNCKWIDLAIYARVTIRDIESARALLEFARESCEAAWVSDRCRIAVADAVFSEVLDDTVSAGVITSGGLSDEDRGLLEFVIEAVSPLVEYVRLSGRVNGALQRAAVEFAVNAYGLLGQLSQIADLVRPMAICRPVPLLLAQLTLRRICEPPIGLSGRLRVEHPNSFTARLLAALLDREIYGRKREALESLIDLRSMACDQGQDAIEQLCQALFETSSAIDTVALARARGFVDSLLGESNHYRLYFDAVAFLFQDRADTALAELNAEPRDTDAVWWQIAAKSHELAEDFDKASECWSRACQLMPHPDMLNHFAGLSIQHHRFEDAVRALKTAATQSPDDPRTLEQLAFAHARLRDYPEAAAIYAKLVQLEPDVATHRKNLALCQARSGDLNSALTSINALADFANPDLDVFSVRAEILKSLDRADEAFYDLEQLRDTFGNDARFLVLYMDTAYRAGEDKSAHLAFQKLIAMQHSGQLPEPLFQSMSLDDLRQIGSERLRQRDSLFSEVVAGKMPWLVAESLLGAVADEAWHRRTQPLRWLSDDISARGEWTIYATNSFSVQTGLGDHTAVSRIGTPGPGEPVVVDMSALITLHRLGHLTRAANYFGKLILPASYGGLPVHDRQRLTAHQPSREQELRVIHDAVQKRLITLVEEAADSDIAFVDEYHDDRDDARFSLADVAHMLRATQRLTSPELDELETVCHRPRHNDRELPRNGRIVFAASTLRTLARYEWFERVLPTLEWSVVRTDYDAEVSELRAYEFQRTIYSAHESMWQETNQLRSEGKIEFRDSPSCRNDHDVGEEGPEPPPFLDAVLLANDLDCRLLADDRLCQAAVLNHRPECADAAFGTDRVLIGLEAEGKLTQDEVCGDLIQLVRWRYRFLVLDARHLKIVAVRSRDNLPGPELREIAAYVQDSARDPGLFCGPEKAELPTPVAFKYFMAWKEVCVEFLGMLWEDQTFSREQLESVTCWCIESLLPAIPRRLLYSPVGRRMGHLTPKAFMLMAMVRFSTVQPLQLANEALRLIARQLGMTEDEFYEAAAEAADDRHD